MWLFSIMTVLEKSIRGRLVVCKLVHLLMSDIDLTCCHCPLQLALAVVFLTNQAFTNVHIYIYAHEHILQLALCGGGCMRTVQCVTCTVWYKVSAVCGRMLRCDLHISVVPCVSGWFGMSAFTMAYLRMRSPMLRTRWSQHNYRLFNLW